MSLPRIAGLVALAASACAPATVTPRPAAPAGPSEDALEVGHVAGLVQAEDRALDWLAAADPRLAARLGERATPEILDRIGTEAVLSEDASAPIHDGALDLFGFRARALAIEHAAKELGGADPRLPEAAGGASPLTRPRLELELLARLVDEERARAADEAKLGEASGDLVRGMLSTWQPPSGADAWQVRDTWVAKHLLEILASLQGGGPHAGPLDVDEALYPLERLLTPLEFPKGAAALARVRMALDADTRVTPGLWSAESIARITREHLGTAVDVTTLGPHLYAVVAKLREQALAVLKAAGDGRSAIEARARELLFIEGPCPKIAGSRVRTAAPPPERAAVCGAVKALADESSRGAAAVALHDDVSLAFAAFDRAPPPRTALLSKPDDERVDSLRRQARERPVVALGLAVAAGILYEDASTADAKAAAWARLGDAPLDVVAREIAASGRPQ